MSLSTYPRKNRIALAAVCLASLMFGLEISSVPVILPTLEQLLQGNFKDMQWIMNAYTIACTTVLMATGTLADRYGRRLIFIISIVLFGITSLVCGLARTMPLLIAGRLLQGISGGAMLICQVAVLSHQFREGKERAKAFAAWGVIFGIGLGFGPLIGGGIVALSNWQWVFLVHVLIAAVTLVLVFAGVLESRDPQARKLDVAGMITLSLAVFGLTYYITQGADIGFLSPLACLILAVTVISFLLFIYAERKSAHPMFDFSIFRIREFSGALLGSAGMNFSFWPFMIYLPVYFQTALGYDTILAGLSLLAYTLPTLVVPPLAEWLALRYRSGIVIPLGMFLIGLGFFFMWYGSDTVQASWLTMLPGSLLAGIGLGFTNTPVTNATTGAVPVARAGMASGIDMSARLITLAINIALMGYLLLLGVGAYLEQALPGTDALQLHRLAELVVTGDKASFRQSIPSLSDEIVHAALMQGFRWVMLYGATGIWILAGLSYVIFNKGKVPAARKAYS